MNILGNNDSKVRVRTKNELEVRKDEFLRICFLLDKLEIKYFLQTGILLGAIRHNGFIPWDWDVELSVFSDEVVKKMDNLIREIEKSGFKIRKYNKELSKLKIDFIGSLPLDTTAYTIQGWSHDKKRKIFWRNKFKVPDYLFNKMKKIELFEKYHFAPDPPEKYLTHQYGNWKKPLQTSDKSIYLTKEFSGISSVKVFIKKFLNVLK
jgi:hypothetical protein